MNNEKGFTLIELVVVIVLLGILSAVAIPKFVDMRTEAAVAQANGVYGAAQAAAALNHAAKLIGKPATGRPSYDASTCSSGEIDDAICLENALDGGLPDGWTASGANMSVTLGSVAYTISVATAETATEKAVLGKNW